MSGGGRLIEWNEWDGRLIEWDEWDWAPLHWAPLHWDPLHRGELCVLLGKQGFSDPEMGQKPRITWERNKIIHLRKKIAIFLETLDKKPKLSTPRRARVEKKTTATQQENNIFDFLNTPNAKTSFLSKTGVEGRSIVQKWVGRQPNWESEQIDV